MTPTHHSAKDEIFGLIMYFFSKMYFFDFLGTLVKTFQVSIAYAASLTSKDYF